MPINAAFRKWNSSHKNKVNASQSHPSQCCPVSWNFRPAKQCWNLSSFPTCEVGKPPSCTSQSREEREVCDVQMRREVTPIYTLFWGWGDTSIGLTSLHLTKADLDNLCMRKNRFKIPFVLVIMRWSLYQNWTSRKEESNATIISIIWAVLRWNLALVANFNTPSQLGRIPLVKPLATITMNHLWIPSLLCFAEHWCNNEEELIESESQDFTTLY